MGTWHPTFIIRFSALLFCRDESSPCTIRLRHWNLATWLFSIRKDCFLLLWNNIVSLFSGRFTAFTFCDLLLWRLQHLKIPFLWLFKFELEISCSRSGFSLVRFTSNPLIWITLNWLSNSNWWASEKSLKFRVHSFQLVRSFHLNQVSKCIKGFCNELSSFLAFFRTLVFC